jgi:hypothetical protein
MSRPFKQRVPEDINDVIEFLGMMVLDSPTFIDRTGYFPHTNIETVFTALNEGLYLIKSEIGDKKYLMLRQMSDRMRAHFEADREKITDETTKGCDIIFEMKDILIASLT